MKSFVIIVLVMVTSINAMCGDTKTITNRFTAYMDEIIYELQPCRTSKSLCYVK